MSRRSTAARAVLLSCVLAAGVAATSAPGAAGVTGTRLTLRGTFHSYAAVTAAGDRTMHAVRTADGSYWLDLAGEPAPASGTQVEVSGRSTDDKVLVDDLEELDSAARTTSARTTAAMTSSATGSTRLLVMRAYWTASRPAWPSRTQAKQTFVAKGKSWFEEVSGGRYTISGSVTPWLRIARPDSCTGSALASMDRAKTKARQAGYRLGGYGRYLLYLPCDGHGMVGLGAVPGVDVWQFGSRAYDVAVHEQGHNLGLRHANARACSDGAATVTWSADCAVIGYGDTYDVMGNDGAGHFQAWFKQRLGWLTGLATLSTSGTRTLTPFEAGTPGLKALRVKVSDSRSYWLEYRTPTGVDQTLSPGSSGVVLRVRATGDGGEPQLLDLTPGGPSTTVGSERVLDWDRTSLPAGSSWTSPERIRFTVLEQAPDGASVAVEFGAPAPAAPDPPGTVVATPTANGARLSWDRPADNGSIITKYVLTATPTFANLPRVVNTLGGTAHSARFTGLDPAVAYTFAVRAHNHVGASTAVAAAPVVPLSAAPTVRLTSPSDGDTVNGEVTVTAEATSNPLTGAPLSTVSLLVDGQWWDSVAATAGVSTYRLTWDTSWADGAHTLRVAAEDEAGQRAVSPPVTVTVVPVP